jgi:hypothetical protein
MKNLVLAAALLIASPALADKADQASQLELVNLRQLDKFSYEIVVAVTVPACIAAEYRMVWGDGSYDTPVTSGNCDYVKVSMYHRYSTLGTYEPYLSTWSVVVRPPGL